jgi:hypothetical protein
VARHRITLVRDDACQPGYYSNEDWIAERRNGSIDGFTIESVEKLPDPPIVKKFEVEITSPSDVPDIQAHHVRNFFFSSSMVSPKRSVTVKEIS